MKSKKIVIFWFVLFCSTAFAQDEKDVNSSFSLGPGLVITDKPYKGIDTTVLLIPMVRYISGQFYISGVNAGYRVLADGDWSLDVIAKGRFDGYDKDDSDRFDGMHDRDMTIDAGGEFALTGDWGESWISVVTDALGEHDGQEIKLGYMKPFEFDKLTLIPSGGLIWQSNNLADYYYGVRSDEAASGRPEYNVGDSTNTFLGFRVQYQYDDRWTLMTGVMCQFLDSKIRKSPIVDDSYTISFLASAIYRF